MVDKIQIERNRNWWERNSQWALQRISLFTESQIAERSCENASIAQSASARYIWDAVALLATGNRDEAFKLLDTVIMVAQFASSENNIRDYVFKNTAFTGTYADADTKSRHQLALRNLGVAMWLRFGHYPQSTFIESASEGLVYYDLRGRELGWSILEDSLIDLAGAGMFDDLSRMFRVEFEYFSRDETPGPKPPVRGPGNSILAVAEYATGNHYKQKQAQKEIASWYKRAQKWEISEFSLWHRLVWAWMRAKFVTQRLDIYDIVQDLKGY